ncbi:MAG: exonuclease domain-containing protein [Anaerolineae bacterium]|nr:exonuclease domain-containing protein [Anaerolineae bacterium]
MSRKLDVILVVDVEATCWSGNPPEGQESEIIEIGVCTLDVVSGERLEKRSILVKPERSKVSEFCTELTGLTHKQVMGKGIAFDKACAILEREFNSRRRIWASYGEYDRSLFQRQCEALGVAYPFNEAHINVKSLFALVHCQPFEVGMVRALEMLDLQLEGKHHRGDDDAWNIANILSKTLLRRTP